MRGGGLAMVLLSCWASAAILTFSISDPSLNNATPAEVQNAAGPAGAIVADLSPAEPFGAASILLMAPLAIWGALALINSAPEETPRDFWLRLALLPVTLIAATGAASAAPTPAMWPYMVGRRRRPWRRRIARRCPRVMLAFGVPGRARNRATLIFVAIAVPGLSRPVRPDPRARDARLVGGGRTAMSPLTI